MLTQNHNDLSLSGVEQNVSSVLWLQSLLLAEL